VGFNVVGYLGVVAMITVTPGPDTVVVARNTLRHGRGSGLATAVGSASGLLCWGLAAGLGVAGVLAASAAAFAVLKLAGAAYLVYLGLKSIRHAGRGALGDAGGEQRQPPLRFGAAARQGLLTNLLNPKAALFFTALLPQFLSTHGRVLGASAVMTVIASAASLLGLTVYAFAFNRGARLMRRPPVRRALDRLTGLVLVGLGVRIALERR